MKKMIVTLAVGLAACAAQANIVVTHGSAFGVVDRTITVTETAADTFSAVADTGTVAPAATGDATATGLIGSFGVTMKTYNDWGDVAGAAALAGGTAETYIAGLTQVNLAVWNNNWGVRGGNNYRIDPLAGSPEAGEVAILTFNTTGLTTGYQLSIEKINNFNYATDGVTNSIIDLYVYNVNTDTITDSAVGYSLSDNGAWDAGFNISDGDLLIMKMNNANTDTDGVGVSYLEFDVIPEPGTLGLVVAFGGGVLFIRRRFMM